MNYLVQHLFQTNREEILSKSLLDCHVKGLHSIMLLDCPGKTIRLYIAMPGHNLADNFPDNDGCFQKPLSLAFHPHHCELTLHCVKGKFTNIEMTETGMPGDVFHEYDRFRYRSKIKDGEMAFTPIGSTKLTCKSLRNLTPNTKIFMPANSIHTVAAFGNEVTAWLVYEGREDAEYLPYAWCNHDLNKIDISGLYRKPTLTEVQVLLSEAGLL